MSQHTQEEQASQSSPTGLSNSESHPRIEDDLPAAEREKYSAKHLGLALRENIKEDITTRLGDREMRVLKLPIPPIETQAQAQAMVSRLFPVFEKAFFINLISQSLSGPVEIYDDADTPQTCYNGNGIIRLNMSIPDRGSPLGERIICILLHDMLHVFLDTYTCKCHSCSKRTARTGGPGVTGHGGVFCNALFGLKEALQSHVQWKVDCDLASCVQPEMDASGWTPSRAQILRWGLVGVGLKAPARAKLKFEKAKAERAKTDRAAKRLASGPTQREPVRGWTRKKKTKRKCCVFM